MTKHASARPTRDKGAPTAPHRHPAWRHYIWIVAIGTFIFLYFFTPATRGEKQVTLNHSQFFRDVSARKVKTVTLAFGGVSRFLTHPARPGSSLVANASVPNRRGDSRCASQTDDRHSLMTTDGPGSGTDLIGKSLQCGARCRDGDNR